MKILSLKAFLLIVFSAFLTGYAIGDGGTSLRNSIRFFRQIFQSLNQQYYLERGQRGHN